MCQHCILSTFPSPVKKYHRHIIWVGFDPTTFAILQQCLTNQTIEITRQDSNFLQERGQAQWYSGKMCALEWQNGFESHLSRMSVVGLAQWCLSSPSTSRTPVQIPPGHYVDWVFSPLISFSQSYSLRVFLQHLKLKFLPCLLAIGFLACTVIEFTLLRVLGFTARIKINEIVCIHRTGECSEYYTA